MLSPESWGCLSLRSSLAGLADTAVVQGVLGGGRGSLGGGSGPLDGGTGPLDGGSGSLGGGSGSLEEDSQLQTRNQTRSQALRAVTSFKLHKGLTLPFFRRGNGSSNEEETHQRSQSWPLTTPCSTCALKLFAPSRPSSSARSPSSGGFCGASGRKLLGCLSITHSLNKRSP